LYAVFDAIPGNMKILSAAYLFIIKVDFSGQTRTSLINLTEENAQLKTRRFKIFMLYHILKKRMNYK
jgi:hypothetical protein